MIASFLGVNVRTRDNTAAILTSAATRKTLVKCLMGHCSDEITRQYLAMMAMHTGIRPEVLRDAQYQPTKIGTCSSNSKAIFDEVPCIERSPFISIPPRGKQDAEHALSRLANFSRVQSLTTQWEDQEQVEALLGHLASLQKKLND
jgi:hypothetical protein